MTTGLSGVLIVSDIRLYREGLAAFLAEDSRVGALESCSGAKDAEEMLAHTSFAAVCVDFGMACAETLIQRLVAQGCTVVVLGMNNDPATVMAWLEAGVAGYVCKDASLDELIRVFESAVNHEVLCSREVAALLHGRVAGVGPQRAEASPAELTRREHEISALLEAGWSNKRIARHLNITVSTTKNHVHNILEKLGVSSRAEAAALLRLGERNVAGLAMLRASNQ